MIKYAILPILLLTTIACERKIRIKPSDAVLVEYAKDIAEESPVHIRLDYSIRFVDELENDVIGQCRAADGRPIEVVILRSYWEKSSELARYALLTHEMVHCSLYLGHIIDSVDPDGKLMSKTITGAIQCLSRQDIGPCIQQSVDLYYTGHITALGKGDNHGH